VRIISDGSSRSNFADDEMAKAGWAWPRKKLQAMASDKLRSSNEKNVVLACNHLDFPKFFQNYPSYPHESGDKRGKGSYGSNPLYPPYLKGDIERETPNF